MENVTAGQLFAIVDHIVAANDANVVREMQLLGRGVRVQGVHVLDGPSG